MPTFTGMHWYGDNSGTMRRQKLEAKRRQKWEAMKKAAREKRATQREETNDG
ncbi:hypothetical protein [Gemmatimonas sp.]